MTKFCSTVVRTVSFVKRRTMSASERKLIGRDVAEGKRDGDHGVARLLLRAHVCLAPALERHRPDGDAVAAGHQRRLLGFFGLSNVISNTM